jgi:hypothetical protein
VMGIFMFIVEALHRCGRTDSVYYADV